MLQNLQAGWNARSFAAGSTNVKFTAFAGAGHNI